MDLSTDLHCLIRELPKPLFLLRKSRIIHGDRLVVLTNDRLGTIVVQVSILLLDLVLKDLHHTLEYIATLTIIRLFEGL